MKYIYYSTFLLVIAFLSSCTGEYDEDIANVIKNKDSEKSIAITGIINSEYKQQTIVVSRSLEFSELYASTGVDPQKLNDSFVNRRVSGAKVYVEVAGKKYEFKETYHTRNLNWNETYDEIYYESIDSFAGVPNQEHKLVVEVEGKTYTATDVMPKVSEISFNEKSPLCLYIMGIDDTTTVYPEYLFGQQEAFVMGFKVIPTQEAIEIFGAQTPNYDELIADFGHPSYSFRQLAAPQLIGEISEGAGYATIKPNRIDNSMLTDTIAVSKISCSPSYEYFLYCLFQDKKGGNYDYGDISSNLPTNISNVGFFSACDVTRKNLNKWELTHLAESIGNIIKH